MKKLYFIFLSFFQICCANSSFDWLKNRFLGKSYQAVDAYRKQDYDQALSDLHHGMDKKPYDIELNYNVGTVLYKQQKYQDATHYFLRAIQESHVPNQLQEQAYFNVGNCYYQQKQWQQAIDAYQQLLRLHPGDQRAQHNLQLALYKLQEEQMQQNQQPDQQQNNQQQNNQDDQQSQQDKDNSSGQEQDKQQQQGDDQQQDKSCQGGQQDKSQSGKNGQQQNKKDGQQQQGKKQDPGQDQQSDAQDQQQGKESDDNESGQSEQDGSSASGQQDDGKQAGKNQNQSLDQDDAQQKNEQALQDLQDQIEQAGKHDDHHEQVEIQNVDDQFDASKQDMRGAYKKPELKNDLQSAYQNKASDDERLNEYHASLMKNLEDLEEQIQKHVIKNKVAMQGTLQDGKKGW